MILEKIKKIGWTDCVRNKEVLRGVKGGRKEGRSIPHKIKEERLSGLVTPCVRTAV
jgi:hypothetical protein